MPGDTWGESKHKELQPSTPDMNHASENSLLSCVYAGLRPNLAVEYLTTLQCQSLNGPLTCQLQRLTLTTLSGSAELLGGDRLAMLKESCVRQLSTILSS